MAEKCCTCQFWHKMVHKDRGGSGECLRYPPVIVRADDSMEELYEWYGDWPKTDRLEWCGEFKENHG